MSLIHLWVNKKEWETIRDWVIEHEYVAWFPETDEYGNLGYIRPRFSYKGEMFDNDILWQELQKDHSLMNKIAFLFNEEDKQQIMHFKLVWCGDGNEN